MSTLQNRELKQLKQLKQQMGAMPLAQTVAKGLL